MVLVISRSDVMAALERPSRGRKLGLEESGWPGMSSDLICGSSPTMTTKLNPFQYRRGAHAGADAERDEAGFRPAALHFVQQDPEHHCAGCAERMTHRNRAAIHVQLFMRNAHCVHESQHDGRERLVQLPEVDVFLA